MIFGFFRYLEEICEIPIKFDAFSAKIGAKIAKFQWFCLKFMKMSPKFATKICWIFEVGEVQRNINLVDLAKSFPTSYRRMYFIYVKLLIFRFSIFPVSDIYFLIFTWICTINIIQIISYTPFFILFNADSARLRRMNYRGPWYK